MILFVKNYFSLKSAELIIGEVSMQKGRHSLVEVCNCPMGYKGLSCESCDWGYAMVTINSSYDVNHHKCVKCDCNGHSETCDLAMSECGVRLALISLVY